MSGADLIRIGVYPRPTGRIIVAPMHLGLARGYFADLGVEISIEEPADHPWHAIGRGEVDCGLSFIDYCTWEGLYPSLVAIAVQEQWTEGRGMTSLLARNELLESGELSSDPASLKGRRVGLLPGRADDYLCFQRVLQQAGLTTDDVVAVPTPHGSAARREWLEAGKVDVIIGRRPASIADEIAAGHVGLWKSGSDIWPDLQARYWVANADFLKSRRDVAVRFLQGYLKGTKDVLDAYTSAEAGDLTGLTEISELTGEPVERLTSIKPVGYHPTGAIDMDLLGRDVDQMRAADLFPQQLDVHEVVDLDVAAEAASA